MATQTKDWRDPALGSPREIEVTGGKLRVFEAGSGEPILFIHGALVNANLWRKVVARLSSDFRCLTLELPLGAHSTPMPQADISPPGLADMIGEAVGALDLDQPVIAANDTGGGLTQIALARNPELAERVVLTSCDAYENFPPRFFRNILWPARFPTAGGIGFAPLRIRALRSTPLAFGWLMRSDLDPKVGDSYLVPYLTDAAIREDFSRLMRTFDPKHTLAAAEALRSYDQPVLVAWSRDDRFFPPAHAERLVSDLPNARLEWIEDSYTFSMEDQPARLAELIAEFAREPDGSNSQPGREAAQA